MKKLFSVMMALVLIVSVFTMFSYADRGLSYTAPKGTPVVDGKVDDIWASAEWTNVDAVYDGTDRAAVPETLKIKLLWDDSYLYFLAEVTDADLNYDNDLVEIYFDEGNEKAEAFDANDSQTRFRWDGKVFQDSGTNCQNNAPGAGVQTATGWITEGAIKLSGTPAEGQKCGLEFMFNIGGAAADFVTALRWNVDTAGGDPAPFTNTTKWGTLILGAAPVVETAAPETDAPAAVGTAPAETVAQTGDAVISVVAIIVLAAAGTIYIGKKRK